MGIDGLGTFLRKKCPAVFRHLPASALFGRRVALDMHFYTYQMFFRNGGIQDALTRDVDALMQRVRRSDIQAVFVFDGSTVGLKPRAHKKRKDAADKIQDVLAALHDEASCLQVETEHMGLDGGSIIAPDLDALYPMPDKDVKMDEGAADAVASLKRRREECETKIVKMETRAMKPSSITFEEVKAQLIQEFGDAAVVIAEDDAERHVAALCKTGAVDYAASGDYDTLVFGSPNVVLDFLKTDAMIILSLDDVVAGLKLRDMAQFRDFCILCGCDFCDKIPGIGPVRALKLLSTHGRIEDVYVKLGSTAVAIDYGFARVRFASACEPRDVLTPVTVTTAAAEDIVVREPFDVLAPVTITTAANEDIVVCEPFNGLAPVTVTTAENGDIVVFEPFDGLAPVTVTTVACEDIVVCTDNIVNTSVGLADRAV